jgi:hypothetical protein
MDYFEKYIKYKNKYLNLKTKLLGGYKPDLNTLNEMQKYVDDGTFTIYDFNVSQKYDILQKFFNFMKDNISLYIIPENFDDFLGKIDYNDGDITKIWSRLNERVSSGKTYNLINDLYLNGDIEIKKKLKISIKTIEDAFIRIFKVFYDPKYNVNIKKKLGDIDYLQISAITDDSFDLYQDNIQIAKDRINNYNSKDRTKDYQGTFSLNSKTYTYKYYYDKKILYIYNDTPDTLKLYMFNVEIDTNGDFCHVFPYTYNNLLLNDIYENSIKQLFTDIATKLNTINSTDVYKILPDGFFHIHVTIPDNQTQYILLTIHALYEITSNVGDITYTYNGQSITRRNMNDLNDPKNISNSRKKHSFYLLFDTITNTHKLYQINSDNTIKFFNNDIEVGISETILGTNIIDINHMENKGVIISKSSKKCSSLCQPECPNGKSDCEKIAFNSKDYYFKNTGNNKFILINEEGDKCASVIIQINFNQFSIILNEPHIFITDIKTIREYQDCKTNFQDINNLISEFGKLKLIKYITLDDGAYIQFPGIYDNIKYAPHNWTYVYLQQRYDMNNNKLSKLSKLPSSYTFQPIKHSIYSCKAGYDIIKPLDITDEKYKEIESIEKYLDFCVAYYNENLNTKFYDLLSNTNNLSTRYINTRKGRPDVNLDSDYKTYDTEYTKFKKFIDNQIQYYVMCVYDDYSQLQNGYVDDSLLMGPPTDQDFNNYFIIDNYNPKTDSLFNIKYKNNQTYSIEVKKLPGNIDLIKSNPNLYDFLVLKNMNSYKKNI